MLTDIKMEVIEASKTEINPGLDEYSGTGNIGVLT